MSWRIIREGDHVFVVKTGYGAGFNLKLISRLTIEDCEAAFGCDKGSVYISVHTGGSSGGAHPTTMQLTYAEARQAFQDSPWARVIPEEKKS